MWALTAPHIGARERPDPPELPDVLQLDDETPEDDDEHEDTNGAIPWQVSPTSE